MSDKDMTNEPKVSLSYAIRALRFDKRENCLTDKQKLSIDRAIEKLEAPDALAEPNDCIIGIGHDCIHPDKIELSRIIDKYRGDCSPKCAFERLLLAHEAFDAGYNLKRARTLAVIEQMEKEASPLMITCLLELKRRIGEVTNGKE